MTMRIYGTRKSGRYDRIEFHIDVNTPDALKEFQMIIPDTKIKTFIHINTHLPKNSIIHMPSISCHDNGLARLTIHIRNPESIIKLPYQLKFHEHQPIKSIQIPSLIHFQEDYLKSFENLPDKTFIESRELVGFGPDIHTIKDLRKEILWRDRLEKSKEADDRHRALTYMKDNPF